MYSRRHGDSLAFDGRRLLPLLSVFLFLGISGPAQAHPESLSNLRLVIGAKDLRATLTLPLRDLTGWFPPGRYHNYIADVVGELQKTGDSLIEVSWDDAAVLTPLSVNVHPGKTGFIIAELRYASPVGGNTLVVRTAQIANLPNDHQQVAWAEDERAGVATSRVIVEQVLTAQDDTLRVELPDVAATTQPAAVAAAPLQTSPTAGALPPRRPESSLALSRTARRVAFVILLVLLVGAILVVFVAFKCRPLFARGTLETSTWITSICGRSN